MSNQSTLQSLLSPIMGNTASFYVSDIIKNSIAYAFLELSGIVDMIMADSNNEVLNNIKVGLSFTGALEGVRLINRNPTIMQADRANFIRFLDTGAYNSLSMLLISAFNFDDIALELIERFNLPLNGDQTRSLLAGILMTVISFLRQIIQRTPSLQSLVPLTNPVLTMSSSIQVGSGNSLN